MATELPDYLVGQKGVNLVQSPLHTPESGLLVGENVEFIRDFGLGGIGSRRPLAVLNATTAFAGPVLAMANVPLPSPFDGTANAGLYVSTEASNVGWLRTEDGVTFTTIADTTWSRAMRVFNNPSNGSHLQKIMRAAVANNSVFFAGDTNFAAQAPTLRKWDGTTDTLLETLSGLGQITDLFYRSSDDLLYLSLLVNNSTGTIFSFDPDTDVLTQVGNGFTVLPPYSVAEYGASLYCGVGTGNVGGDTGEIFLLVGATWTSDYISAVDASSIKYMQQYELDLFAVEQSAANTDVIKRKTGGVWSTTHTPAVASREVHWLIPFDGDLFAFVVDLTNSNTDVVRWDGATWTTDVVLDNIAAPTAAQEWYPLQPIVFGGELYVPVSNGKDNAGTDRIFKRTALGVWSSVTSGRNFQNGGSAVLT